MSKMFMQAASFFRYVTRFVCAMRLFRFFLFLINNVGVCCFVIIKSHKEKHFISNKETTLC